MPSFEVGRAFLINADLLELSRPVPQTVIRIVKPVLAIERNLLQGEPKFGCANESVAWCEWVVTQYCRLPNSTAGLPC